LQILEIYNIPKMQKFLPHFLLFFSFIFLVSCTITKRKYTGGYYVNWHRKTSDAKFIAQPQKVEPVSNKITLSSSSSEKTVIAQKTEKPITLKLVQSVSAKSKEKLVTKSFSDNLTPKSVSSSYTVTPVNTIPGHDQPENNISKKDVRFSWLFCLLGLLCQALFWVISVVNTPLFADSALVGGRLLLPPLALALLIVSLVHCFRVMRGKRNSGLVPIVVLDIAGIIFSVIILILIILYM
jgi:hypothetical protein